MAKLINGNGNPAVYANEDSDWFAAIMGNQTSITAIGEQFRADQADANTIEVFDGVIITKEGRRIQLDANQVDLFEIPTGTQGQTNYYIIGYHLYTDTDSNQFCEVFVQIMESASDTIPEDTFRGGADEVFVSLYRVTQVGLNITDIDLLLPTIKNILQINADLSELSDEVQEKGIYTLSSTNITATGIYPLADDINNYDLLLFTHRKGNNDNYQSMTIDVELFKTGITFNLDQNENAGNRQIQVKYSDDTHINVPYVYTEQIIKIQGIKL